VQLNLKTAKSEDYKSLLDAGTHTIVINNAGVIDRTKFFDAPLETIETLIKTNVHPYVLLVKYACMHFK
jgi:short-subunit dehydrogenase